MYILNRTLSDLSKNDKNFQAGLTNFKFLVKEMKRSLQFYEYCYEVIHTANLVTLDMVKKYEITCRALLACSCGIFFDQQTVSHDSNNCPTIEGCVYPELATFYLALFPVFPLTEPTKATSHSTNSTVHRLVLLTKGVKN